MPTNQEITDFLYTVKYTHSEYVHNISMKERIGLKNYSNTLTRIFLAGVDVKILEDYFNTADVDDTNFFDTDEIMDVLQHFNNITNSNIYIAF